MVNQNLEKYIFYFENYENLIKIGLLFISFRKSSLLQAILGEMDPLLRGSRRVIGKIAYAPQKPWIFSGTIRQNILCGLSYDAHRYQQVIQVSALDRDLQLFPNGDRTMAINERGNQLSEDQKSRISLARCLYVDADVYLMDDPLSAVDISVGRHLFDRAINGFLREKIRVVVTNQLQYLKNAELIMILKEVRR